MLINSSILLLNSHKSAQASQSRPSQSRLQQETIELQATFKLQLRQHEILLHQETIETAKPRHDSFEDNWDGQETRFSQETIETACAEVCVPLYILAIFHEQCNLVYIQLPTTKPGIVLNEQF